MSFDKSILEFIVCPVTGGELTYCEKENLLINKKAGFAYPIEEGIPILIEEESIKYHGK